MDFALQSPQEQIASLTRRIYERGITTASGGNLSIRDQEGNIWITPARMDKGRLRSADVVCVKTNGEIIGKYSPSTELPFHRAIYEKRPDIRAVAHAHCPSLVSFSISQKIPQTRAIAQVFQVCGEVGFASYEITQSKQLGWKIASAFGESIHVVLMENHGIVTAGPDLMTAYQRLETLELGAQSMVHASGLGPISIVDEHLLQAYEKQMNPLVEFDPIPPSTTEFDLREEICRMVSRGYQQHLMSSIQGIVSARLDDHSFLITPEHADRQNLAPHQLVLIQNGRQEKGKIPARSFLLHQQIYKDHPHIHFIISAQPPCAMAYAITGHEYEYKIIAETYITLKSIAFVPFEWQVDAPEKISAMLAGKTPVLLLRNEAIITAGQTALAAFDRLEVAEFCARAQIDAMKIGRLVPLNEEQTREMDRIYFPEMTI